MIFGGTHQILKIFGANLCILMNFEKMYKRLDISRPT